jgi:hypothetical protein
MHPIRVLAALSMRLSIFAAFWLLGGPVAAVLFVIVADAATIVLSARAMPASVFA